MIIKTRLVALFTATLVVAPAGVQAEVFKWKDEKGVTHYSENPPSEPVKTLETLRVKSRASSDADSAIDQLNKSRSEIDKKLVDKTPVAKDEKYKEKCEGLRKDLETIKSSDEVRIKEGDAEPRLMSEKEKQDRLDSTQREIKAYCE